MKTCPLDEFNLTLSEKVLNFLMSFLRCSWYASSFLHCDHCVMTPPPISSASTWDTMFCGNGHVKNNNKMNSPFFSLLNGQVKYCPGKYSISSGILARLTAWEWIPDTVYYVLSMLEHFMAIHHNSFIILYTSRCCQGHSLSDTRQFTTILLWNFSMFGIFSFKLDERVAEKLFKASSYWQHPILQW